MPGAETQSREDHGESRRDDYLADHAHAPGSEGHRRPHEERIGLAHAGIGIDGHGKEHAEGDDGHLGGLAEPEPQDEQREQGDLRNGKRGRDERRSHGLGQREESDTHTDVTPSPAPRANPTNGHLGQDAAGTARQDPTRSAM